MIIGISGRMGSGKDTVAKIIRKLDGAWESRDDMGSGQVWRSKHSWQIKRFAGKLKEIASLLTGIPVEKFEDQEFKKTFLPKEWDYDVPLKRESMLQENKYWETVQMSVREFLQRLGTDGLRDGLHQNVWVNALMSDYKFKQKVGGYQRVVKSAEGIPMHMEYEVEGVENWLITDVRFPNEASAIKEKGGIVIRVNRTKQPVVKGDEVTITVTKGDLPEVALHPSETSLDKWDFDEVIENDGSLEELEEKIKWILENRDLL